MMHLLRGPALGVCLMAWTAIDGHARAPQTPAPAAAVDLDSVGPQVGHALPDFDLADQRGVRRSLKSILGPSGAVIVFFRSADW